MFVTRLHPRLRSATLAIYIVLVALLPTACEFDPEQEETQLPQGASPDPVTPPTPGSSDMGDDTTSPSLTRKPYLQSLTENSVLIVFRTENPMATRVEFGDRARYDATASDAATSTHAVQLHGLTPGRRYYYRIRSGNDILAAGPSYFFDTDAGRSDPEFSFFATGDVGESGGKQAVTAARVAQTLPRAEIGLILGDVIYPDGQAGGYDSNLMRPWAPILRNIAIWPALGNHDWHVNPDTNFRSQWYLPNNEHYYSFDRGNAHFIALDTRDGDIYDRAHQVAWLRSDLAAHRDATWTFVYYHHPGYTCTYKGTNSTVISNLHPVFDEFHVDVVFTGHAHTYERLYPMRGSNPVDVEQDPHYTNPGGTLYITSGCGAKLEGSNTPDCSINAFQLDRTILFTHVTVRGNELHIRAIQSSTGEVRDDVTITKTSARTTL